MNERIKRILKKNTSILIALVFLSSALVVPAYGFISGLTSVSTTNAVLLEGVASLDSYDSMQYSYKINQWACDNDVHNATSSPTVACDYTPYTDYFNAGKSLRLGMTAFGEFTSNTTGGITGGIAYGANATEWNTTESWASNYINSKEWIQGWTFSMNYTRQTIGRSIEAWALYSDFTHPEAGRGVWSWGSQDWGSAQGTVNFGLNSTYGDIVQGYLVPSGISILYDSARLVIARTTVTIWDNFYNEPVAQITFTLVLNKDSKIAIIYKDVKILLDAKVLDYITGIAFSERYELDLARGINPSNEAWIHWFQPANDGSNQTTVYQHPLTGSSSYDVVQAFTNSGSGMPNYTFFAAYWPNVTEHSVYSALVPLRSGNLFYDRVLPVGTAISDMPSPAHEPTTTPWVIAQWLYNQGMFGDVNMTNLLGFLAKGGASDREIRFVEVVGMTDGPTQAVPLDSIVQPLVPLFGPRPPDDADIGAGHFDVIGMEEQYLLSTVFNPIDFTNSVFGDYPGGDGFQWIGLGQSAATTDSGASAMVSAGLVDAWGSGTTPLVLFDRNDTLFPWEAPIAGMQGSIPYGLNEFNGSYIQAENNAQGIGEVNVTGGVGRDATTYYFTALKGYAFGIYDDDITGPAQPIAGGFSGYGYWWMPSKSPLGETWYTYYFGYEGFTGEYYPLYRRDMNGIVTIGGEKANGLTRYFNDFSFAITREGTDSFAYVNGGNVTGTAPTSNPGIPTFDFFPVSSWASSTGTGGFGYTAGYAVISIVQDINGTRGLSIYGWNGRDTYWAGAWASVYLNNADTSSWLPPGTVALILHITYGPGTTESTSGTEPLNFNVVQALGTITQFGSNLYATSFGPFPFDRFPTLSWNGVLGTPTFNTPGQAPVWWYEKLPTTTTASVQFDP